MTARDLQPSGANGAERPRPHLGGSLPIDTILVPLDWSDCAHDLVARAVDLAGQLGARIHLLHVVEVPSGLALDARVQPPGQKDATTVRAWMEADAAGRMPPYVAQANAAGIEVTTTVVIGPIVTSILDVATRVKADMVLMGTHGRTGLRRAVAGSVAEEVLRHADVPVLTVRTQHQPGCTARSCQECTLGRSDAEERLRDEMAG